MNKLIIKRAYETAEVTDGYRILVDRIWPRGVSKEKAQLNEWNKELAPSTELRKWFGHKPERFEEFKTRYLIELKAQEGVLKQIDELRKKQQVCLVYGAKDEAHNQAVILKAVIENLNN